MSGFVRSSHYRHIFVEQPKIEHTYRGFRLSTAICSVCRKSARAQIPRGNGEGRRGGAPKRGRRRIDAGASKTGRGRSSGHVLGLQKKRDAQATGEQQYIKGNSKFFAVALQGGGGPFACVPYENKGTRNRRPKTQEEIGSGANASTLRERERERERWSLGRWPPYCFLTCTRRVVKM